MNVVLQSYDLSEDYLRFAAQIGADGVDISPRRGWAELVPGVADRGYADERGLRALMDRLRRWGLRLYRVSTVQPVNYLLGRPGGDAEVENLCRTVAALVADPGRRAERPQRPTLLRRHAL
jgi:sugar phosphate isomerase/epimerase